MLHRPPPTVDSRQLDRRATGSLASTDLFPSPPHRPARPIYQHTSFTPQSLDLPPPPSSSGLSPIVEYGIAVDAPGSAGGSLTSPLAVNSRAKQSQQGLAGDTTSFVLQPAPRPTRPPPPRPPPTQLLHRQASLDSTEAMDHSATSFSGTDTAIGSKAASQATAATSVSFQSQLNRGRFYRQQHREESHEADDERWEGWIPRRRTSRKSLKEEGGEGSTRIDLRADSAAMTLRQMMSGPTTTTDSHRLTNAPSPTPTSRPYPSPSPLIPIVPLFADRGSRSATTLQDGSSALHEIQHKTDPRARLLSVKPTSTLRSGWDPEEKESRRARKERKRAEKTEMKAKKRHEGEARGQEDTRRAAVELPAIETLLGEQDRFSLNAVLHELEAAQERVARGESNQPRPPVPSTGADPTRAPHLAAASDVTKRARNLFSLPDTSQEDQSRARGLRRWFGRRTTSTPSQPAAPNSTSPSSDVPARYQSSPSPTKRPTNRLRKPPPTHLRDGGPSELRRPSSPPRSLPSPAPQLSPNLPSKHEAGIEDLALPLEEVHRRRRRSQSLPSRLPPSLAPDSSTTQQHAPLPLSFHLHSVPSPSSFDSPVGPRHRSSRATRRGDGEVRAALISSWLEGVAGSETGREESKKQTILLSPRATVFGLWAEQEKRQTEAEACSATEAPRFESLSTPAADHPALRTYNRTTITSSYQRSTPLGLLETSTLQHHFAESTEPLDFPKTPSPFPRNPNETLTPSLPRATTYPITPSTASTSTLIRQPSLRGRVSPFPLLPIPINSCSSSPNQLFTAPRPAPLPPRHQAAPRARRAVHPTVTFADEPMYDSSKTQSSSSSGFNSSSSADAHLFVDRSLPPRRPPRPPSDVLVPSSIPYSRSHRDHPRPRKIPERAQVQFVPPTLVRRTPSLVRTSALNAHKPPTRGGSRAGLLEVEEDVESGKGDETRRASVMSELSEVSEGTKLLAPGEARSLRARLLRALPQEGSSREGLY